jgi:Spy/CpxP family protein refolding chaperone
LVLLLAGAAWAEEAPPPPPPTDAPVVRPEIVSPRVPASRPPSPTATGPAAKPEIVSPRAPATRPPPSRYSYARSHPILKYLSLTPEQAEKIDAAFEEGSAARTAVYTVQPPTDPVGRQKAAQERMQKLQEMHKQTEEKMVEVLNPEQKEKYQKAMAVKQEYEKVVQETIAKLAVEREDKLMGILGEAYKMEAERNKGMARGDPTFRPPPPGSRGPLKPMAPQTH